MPTITETFTNRGNGAKLTVTLPQGVVPEISKITFVGRDKAGESTVHGYTPDANETNLTVDSASINTSALDLLIPSNATPKSSLYSVNFYHQLLSPDLVYSRDVQQDLNNNLPAGVYYAEGWVSHFNPSGGQPYTNFSLTCYKDGEVYNTISGMSYSDNGGHHATVRIDKEWTAHSAGLKIKLGSAQKAAHAAQLANGASSPSYEFTGMQSGNNVFTVNTANASTVVDVIIEYTYGTPKNGYQMII